MAIVNLDKRVTDNWEKRCMNLESPESTIYVKDRAKEMVQNPASMEIDVGNVYILPGSSIQYRIPDEGLVVKPKQSVIIYSQQKISLPYNVFGVVTGKGNFIFQGCFISTGKIDPGFDGYLKVGFYNGSNKKITVTPGKGFASVYFINTEFTMTHSLENYQMAPPADTKKISIWKVAWDYVCAHWIGFLAWTLGVLPTAIYSLVCLLEKF